MTTIAWDGVTLAADKRRSFGNTPVDTTVKVFRFTKHKKWKGIALCGNVVGAQAMLELLTNKRDELSSVDPDEYGAIVIDHKNQAWSLSGHLLPLPLPDKWAMGSGGDYALGALHAGKTAVEAIEIATKLDNNTGGGVDAIRFE